MEMVPVQELLSLLTTTDGHVEMNEQIYLLLADYFALVDVESVMSSYGDQLREALQSAQPEVVLLGVSFVRRLMVPTVRKDLLSDGLLIALTRLLACQDTRLGQTVVECFKQSSDVMLLFGRPLLDRIFDELKREHPEGLVEARIAQIMISSTTDDDGAARWGEHMRILERSPSRDPLLALVALQEIEEGCATGSDLESAEAAGLVDRIAMLAQDDSGRVPEEVRARALTTLGGLCRVEHRMVDSFEARFRLGPFLRSILNLEDGGEALKIASYSVIASLATNGKLTLRGWLNDDLLTASAFIAPVASGIGNLASAALAACVRIFETSLPSNGANPAQRALYASLAAIQAGYPIDVVIARCHSLDEDIGQTAYRLLSAMLQHSWIIEDSINRPSGLIKFLFDREGEPSLHGLQSRYLIIQALVASGHIHDPDLLARLHRYLQRGVNYYAATPSISTLRRS